MAQVRADATLNKGYRLDEFTIRRVLGRGGFGITYLAQEDPPVARRMAVKEYLPRGVAMRGEDGTTVRPMEGDEEIYGRGLERFEREAGTLARFRHPNIVEVHRFLRACGTAYLIMLYEDGDSLDAVLERHDTLPQAKIEEMLYPLLDGLEAVHEAGFLHRDIKPGNIYIRKRDGSPVLLDFGAARQSLGFMTQDMTSFITRGYSPFEQYSSNSRQGPWTDIYALAATLYRLVSGRKPPESIGRLEEDDLVAAVNLGGGDYRQGFLAAIDRALAVKSRDRPQSIADWRAMLEDGRAAKAPSKAVKPAPAGEHTLATGPAAPSPRKRRRAGLAIAVLAVVAALGAGGYWGWSAYQGSGQGQGNTEVAKRRAEEARKRREAEAEAARSGAEARRRAEEERKRREAARFTLGYIFRDCPQCPAMVVIPGGVFTMGSPSGEKGRDEDEGPPHRVIVQRLAMGKYEVTRQQYAAFVRDTGRGGGGCYVRTGSKWRKDPSKGWRNPGFEQFDRDPVACVSWNDAKQYVGWLSRTTGKRYRLPSEAEWEYAARAGTRDAYWWGDAIGRNKANCKGCGSRWDNQKTAPVGSFRPNRFGLHDVHGNVWEWVEDCRHDSYAGAPANGRPWTTGGNCLQRVLRGGSWVDFPRFLRSALRFRVVTGNRVDNVGFRVARTLP